MQNTGRYLLRLLLVIAVLSVLLPLLPGAEAQTEKGPHDTALVYGTIYNMTSSGSIAELEDYRVSISRDDFIPRSNLTDDNGYYEIWLPPSSEQYTIEVRNPDGELVRSKKVFINSTDPYEFDVEVRFKEEEEEQRGLRDYMTIIGDFLKDGAVFIIIGIALIPIVFILLAVLYGFFEKLQKIEKLPTEITIIVKRFFMLAILLIFFSTEYVLIYNLFDLPGNALSIAVRVMVAMGIIVFFFFVLRVALLVLNKLIVYYRKKLEAKEETQIYSRALLIFEFIIKYILILAFAILMIIALLAALGFEDIIFIRIADFFLTKFGFIIMLGLLIIIAISVQRFSKSFFEDLRKRPGTKKLSPGLMFIIEKSIKISMYLVLGILAIFTILSAMGLGDLGQTIILMMSVIIGFVVSMAATGSIGNALSGLVLYGFKPLEKGDRVTLRLSENDSFTGDVENIDLMFTTFRDLEGQVVRIPNNIVMSHKVVNHSKSEKPGFAVVVDVTIGYDVPAEKVKDLMRTSAIETQGVLSEPKPFVLLTKFHNHAIEYRLRAYIDNAKAMFPIRSAIMRRMQKNFAMHGIEILSPLYHVKREEPKPSREDISKVFTAVEQADQNQDEFSIDQGAAAAFEGLAVMEALDHVSDDSIKTVEKKKKGD